MIGTNGKRCADVESFMAVVLLHKFANRCYSNGDSLLHSQGASKNTGKGVNQGANPPTGPDRHGGFHPFDHLPPTGPAMGWHQLRMVRRTDHRPTRPRSRPLHHIHRRPDLAARIGDRAP